MVVSRTSASLGRTVLRRAATQSRTQAWRQTARRYASTGTASAEKAKKTSDIPWLIGSVAFTVPAAVWLLGQGPEKSDHSHGGSHEAEGEAKEEEDAPAEESSEEKPDESSEEKSDDKTEGKSEDESDEKTEEKSEEKPDDKSDESTDKDEKKSSEGDDKKSEDSSDEGSDDGEKKDTPDTSEDEGDEDKPSPGSPGQINYKPSMEKGPGEQQKGPRKKSETAGEKGSAKDTSGAKHPYLDDDEKSKKGEGLKDTQKIHGTVASDRPLR